MPPRKTETPIDMGLILPATAEKLREEARDKVAARLRKKAEEALLAKYEKEFEQELNEDPNEEMRDILIDLPGHAEYMRIDNSYFYHGRTYQVRASVYDFLMAQMQTSWVHEEEIGGANRDAYTKPRNSITHNVGTFGTIGSRF